MATRIVNTVHPCICHWNCGLHRQRIETSKLHTSLIESIRQKLCTAI